MGRSFDVLDEWLRTDEPGVYAIGDVTGPPWLAHKASHEGIVCVEKIASLDKVRSLDRSGIPSCVYGPPQVVSLGLTEREAHEQGHEVRVGRFPCVGNGKAVAWARRCRNCCWVRIGAPFMSVFAGTVRARGKERAYSKEAFL